MAAGDFVAARRWADEAAATTTGWRSALALLARARVAIAQGERSAADADAHDALACAVGSGAYISVPDCLECLADLARDVDSHQAARLFGAAEALRRRMEVVRFQVYQAGLPGFGGLAARCAGQQCI
ncbi:transcriptional regulator, luxR-family [Mycobacterium kansasii 732]|nr:transcriptional regulator, luxR-family [Mycobacterium kansasii 732]